MSLLDRLSPDDRRKLVQAAVRRRYRGGDTVFHAGDPGDTLHLISTGRATIEVLTPLGDTVTLALLGPGQCFGELALLGGGVRSASVVALEPLETLTLMRGEVDRLRATSRAVQNFLIEVLTDQVSRLTSRVTEAHFSTADVRIVRRLAEAVRLFSDAPDDLVDVVPLTQRELAGLAGTTRPTVNRVLRELVRSGAIEIRRGRIRILDLEQLDRRAR